MIISAQKKTTIYFTLKETEKESEIRIQYNFFFVFCLRCYLWGRLNTWIPIDDHIFICSNNINDSWINFHKNQKYLSIIKKNMLSNKNQITIELNSLVRIFSNVCTLIFCFFFILFFTEIYCNTKATIFQNIHAFSFFTACIAKYVILIFFFTNVTQ